MEKGGKWWNVGGRRRVRRRRCFYYDDEEVLPEYNHSFADFKIALQLVNLSTVKPRISCYSLPLQKLAIWWMLMRISSLANWEQFSPAHRYGTRHGIKENTALTWLKRLTQCIVFINVDDEETILVRVRGCVWRGSLKSVPSVPACYKQCSDLSMLKRCFTSAKA